MIDKRVPFIVRRARLLLGMTLAEFAGLYGVIEEAVAQWERGLAHPAPQVWARIRSITLSASSLLDEELVKASPLCKFIVEMEDLTQPIVASKGFKEALDAVGASEGENHSFDLGEYARKSPSYEVSGLRALEHVQSDPGWLSGDIVYGEAHCVAVPLGGVWVDAMIAPLPDRSAALIEFVPSRRGAEGGFWVVLSGSKIWPRSGPEREQCRPAPGLCREQTALTRPGHRWGSSGRSRRRSNC
jgi:transcriptional regulator with XRE-family HTH domain